MTEKFKQGNKMPQIIILPHVELCPDGAAIEAKTGDSICEVLLKTILILTTPATKPAPARLAM